MIGTQLNSTEQMASRQSGGSIMADREHAQLPRLRWLHRPRRGAPLQVGPRHDRHSPGTLGPGPSRRVREEECETKPISPGSDPCEVPYGKRVMRVVGGFPDMQNKANSEVSSLKFQVSSRRSPPAIPPTSNFRLLRERLTASLQTGPCVHNKANLQQTKSTITAAMERSYGDRARTMCSEKQSQFGS